MPNLSQLQLVVMITLGVFMVCNIPGCNGNRYAACRALCGHLMVDYMPVRFVGRAGPGITFNGKLGFGATVGGEYGKTKTTHKVYGQDTVDESTSWKVYGELRPSAEVGVSGGFDF